MATRRKNFGIVSPLFCRKSASPGNCIPPGVDRVPHQHDELPSGTTASSHYSTSKFTSIRKTRAYRSTALVDRWAWWCAAGERRLVCVCVCVCVRHVCASSMARAAPRYEGRKPGPVLQSGAGHAGPWREVHADLKKIAIASSCLGPAERQPGEPSRATRRSASGRVHAGEAESPSECPAVTAPSLVTLQSGRCARLGGLGPPATGC